MSREIDALIAEHVMGFIAIKDPLWVQVYDAVDGWVEATPDGERRRSMPLYSTDIAAAWEVVEKLQPLFFRVEQRGTKQEYWFSDIWVGPGQKGHWEADTAPMAICLAALKAKNVEVPGE